MPATATIETPVLSPADVSRFFHQGFLVVERLTTPDDLASVQELLDGLFDRWRELPPDLAFDLGDLKNHDGAQRMPQINVAIRFEPRLRDTLVFRNAEAMAKQILGEQAAYSFDHAIYKPPRNGREVPWHQDLSYGRNPDHIVFNANFWVPLQDATLENGCMEFIPFSHWGNLLPHRPVGGDPKVHTLEAWPPVDTRKRVACPVKVGGATIQHGKTLHYTGPNNTDKPRRAWILNFSAPVENSWTKAEKKPVIGGW